MSDDKKVDENEKTISKIAGNKINEWIHFKKVADGAFDDDTPVYWATREALKVGRTQQKADIVKLIETMDTENMCKQMYDNDFIAGYSKSLNELKSKIEEMK